MRKKFDSKASQTYYTPTEGALSTYINELQRCKVLEDSEIRKLAVLAQGGDKSAADKIVRSNLKFTFSIAKRFSKGDYDLLCDLVSEANIGLFESINKFDLNYSNKFITFSKDWMLKRVYEYLAIKNDTIKVSNKRKNHKTNEISNKFYLENGRTPDTVELYDIMGDESVDEISVVNIDTTYLSEYYDERNNDSDNFDINSFNHNEFESTIEADYTKHIIESSIGVLTEKEQSVVRMLYGIGHFIPMETEMVADAFGVTSEAIRHINKRALVKMKHKIKKEIVIF